jgi:transposase InsO family protein
VRRRFALPSSAVPKLPKRWTRSVHTALVHVMSLAHYALVQTRSWAANGSSERARLSAKCDQLDHEVRLLRDEIRIKDARLARIPAVRRPHYPPTERLGILELRALRGWSLAQTARVFHVTPATIASWSNRLDEEGPNALVRTPVPVNKYPDFVRYLVQRLRVLCPRLGKVKIAQVLARAGLHVGVTSVGRMRRESPMSPTTPRKRTMACARRVTAKYPNHLWHADLTTVPTSGGFWISWLPFALPPCWPFCWWLAVVLDHYSRRVLGFAVFVRQPTSEKIRRFLGQVIGKVGAAPRHLVTDQGKQFTSRRFRNWCHRQDIRQRFGAVGQQGSIAVIERFWRTLKESMRAATQIPLARRAFHGHMQLAVAWYNGHRPHMTLWAATPDEGYFARRPACPCGQSIQPKARLRLQPPPRKRCHRSKTRFCTLRQRSPMIFALPPRSTIFSQFLLRCAQHTCRLSSSTWS